MMNWSRYVCYDELMMLCLLWWIDVSVCYVLMMLHVSYDELMMLCLLWWIDDVMCLWCYSLCVLLCSCYVIQRDLFLQSLTTLRVLGKFLGFIAFLPYQSTENMDEATKQICVRTRNQVCVHVCARLFVRVYTCLFACMYVCVWETRNVCVNGTEIILDRVCHCIVLSACFSLNGMKW